MHLPNLLADQPLVREFIQDDMTPANPGQELLAMQEDARGGCGYGGTVQPDSCRAAPQCEPAGSAAGVAGGWLGSAAWTVTGRCQPAG